MQVWQLKEMLDNADDTLEVFVYSRIADVPYARMHSVFLKGFKDAEVIFSVEETFTGRALVIA